MQVNKIVFNSFAISNSLTTLIYQQEYGTECSLCERSDFKLAIFVFLSVGIRLWSRANSQRRNGSRFRIFRFHRRSLFGAFFSLLQFERREVCR